MISSSSSSSLSPPTTWGYLPNTQTAMRQLFMLMLLLALNYLLLGVTIFTNPLFLVNLPPTTLSSPPRALSTDDSSGGRSGSGSGSTTISREVMSNTIVARDNDHTSGPHPPSPVMVAIICDAKSLSTLGPVVLETWTRNLPYDFRFFTGEAEYITTTDGEKIESNKTLIPKALRPYTIRLEAPDGYPPRKKELTMFKYLHDHFLVNHAQYSWYMKVDIDSYLNGAELEKVVKRLVASGTTKGYIGNPGLGREFERHSLGLNGPFCMGFGYLLGRETLVQLRPKLDWCLAHPHSEHSDTEMGNCIYKTSKTTCQHPNLPKDKGQKFVNYYFNYGQDGLVTNAKVESNSSNQQIHSNQAIYFGTPLQAVLVHALKKPADMRKLHQQLTRNLRPTFAAPWMQFKDKNANATTTYSLSGAHNNRTQMPPELVESAAAKQMDRFLATACVNNPLVQLHSQENGFLLPECEPPMQPHRGPTNTSPVHMTRSDIPTIPTYVLNLPHRREEFEAMAQKFAISTSLNLTRFEAINGVELYSQESMPQIRGEGYRRMKPGEQGYRMSMRVLLQKGLQDGTKFMLVLDDDAVPHNDFDTNLLNLLNDNRCGGHLLSEHEGGTMQMGASIHRRDIWDLIDDDIAKSTTQNHAPPLCFNSHLKVLGSYGVVYHRNTFQEILDWIDYGPIKPFDWVFDWLARKGYVTRVASTFIIIPDVGGKVSQVNPERSSGQLSMKRRAEIHRWDLNAFNKTLNMSFVDVA